MRRVGLSATVLAMAVWAAPSALAQAGAGGLLGIAPSRREVVARPPVNLTPVQFTNTTRLSYRIRIFAAIIRQDPGGVLLVDDSPKARRYAARVARISPPLRYLMRPDQRRDVSVRWLRTPHGVKAIPLAVVMQATPTVKRGQIRNIIRLVNTNFLQVPGPARRAGGFVRFAAAQGGPRQLVLNAALENRGQRFERPAGVAAVRNSAGRVVASFPFPRGNLVIPGGERDFEFTIRKPLPTGRYVAAARVSFAGRLRTATTGFTLVAPGTLPTAKFTMAPFNAHGEVGSVAKARIQVRNSGTKAGPATLRVQLAAIIAGQAAVEATKSVSLGTMTPGATKSVDVSLGKLKKGFLYGITGVVISKGQRSASQSSRFRASKAESGGGVLVWILILVGLAAVGFLIARTYRRQPGGAPARPRRSAPAARASRSAPAPAAPPSSEPTPVAAPPPPEPEPEPVAPPPPEPEPEPAPAPPPPPPAPEVPPAPAAASVPVPPSASSGGRINLNSASADDLVALPGIGPGAARRIVAHREEYGEFASVSDLTQVEGFDDARVRRLADRATV